MTKHIFRTKSISEFISETKQDGGMNRVLGTFGLTMLGIGAIVGTGIFVLTGVAAANYSGPALIISFIIAALACGCAALCYAEFAAMVPVAGSAYTYGYVALGEFWAWVIGWDLILEYAFAVSAVAIGWSGYFNNILTNLGIVLPKALTLAPYDGGIVNLPAVLILCAIAFINIHGVRQSATVNNIIVGIKLAVVALFLALGFSHVDAANWVPFMPYGWSGVFAGDPSSSSLTSVSMLFLRRLKKSRIRRKICPAASSCRSSSARSCTSPYRLSSPGWFRTSNLRRQRLRLLSLSRPSAIIGALQPFPSALFAVSLRFSWS